MLKITRAPQVRRRKKWKLYPCRQYANDVMRCAIQSQRLADDISIAAKAAMPERVTDYDHRLAGCLRVTR